MSYALAVVTAEIDGPARGLEILDSVYGIERFQPAWAARTKFLERLFDWDGARQAYERAIDLSPDGPVRRHLRSRADDLK